MAQDVARLGRHVRERREQLDLNQLQVAEAGGPSNTTLTKIENGQVDTVSAATLRKLDEALRWKRGSARAVLLGGDPVPWEGLDADRMRGGFVAAPGDREPGAAADDRTVEQMIREARDLLNAIEAEYRKTKPGS